MIVTVDGFAVFFLLPEHGFHKLRDCVGGKFLVGGEAIGFVQEDVDIHIRTGTVEINEAGKLTILLQDIRTVQITLEHAAGQLPELRQNPGPDALVQVIHPVGKVFIVHLFQGCNQRIRLYLLFIHLHIEGIQVKDGEHGVCI